MLAHILLQLLTLMATTVSSLNVILPISTLVDEIRAMSFHRRVAVQGVVGNPVMSYLRLSDAQWGIGS